jgi:hypothetical protein
MKAIVCMTFEHSILKKIILKCHANYGLTSMNYFDSNRKNLIDVLKGKAVW